MQFLFETVLRVSPLQQLVYLYLASWMSVQALVLFFKTSVGRTRPVGGSAKGLLVHRHVEQVRVDFFKSNGFFVFLFFVKPSHMIISLLSELIRVTSRTQSVHFK